MVTWTRSGLQMVDRLAQSLLGPILDSELIVIKLELVCLPSPV